MTDIDIGIDKPDRIAITDGLKTLLATSYTLYLQTHYFHWNVTGPLFRELHLLFEEQYQELAEAVDDIAERIRTLDVIAPGTYRSFAELSQIEEVQDVPAAADMVDILTRGNEQVVKTLRSLSKVAAQAGDESTADLAATRLGVHEKAAWMLRSHRERPTPSMVS